MNILPSVRNGQVGFSLIELVVTLMVVAVLVTIGAPTMRTVIQNNRISTATNDLIADINLTRSEAIKRFTPVGICMSATGNACDGASWTAGRVIFVDANSNWILDVGEDVLRTREALPANTLTSALPNPLLFNQRGLPLNAGAGGDFSLCDDRGPTHGRLIQISPTGQTSSIPNPPAC